MEICIVSRAAKVLSSLKWVGNGAERRGLHRKTATFQHSIIGKKADEGENKGQVWILLLLELFYCVQRLKVEKNKWRRVGLNRRCCQSIHHEVLGKMLYNTKQIEKKQLHQQPYFFLSFFRIIRRFKVKHWHSHHDSEVDSFISRLSPLPHSFIPLLSNSQRKESTHIL